MTVIILGSQNPHKVGEIKAILAEQDITVKALPDGIPDVVEDRETFRGNAAKKALEYAQRLDAMVLADDSGLCVDAIGGAPGVYSARFSGPGATHASNNKLLLEKLQGVDDQKRGAEFVCTMVLADPEGVRLIVSGRLKGRILKAPRGGQGFGYDPLFVPTGHDQSLAEMTPEHKNSLSHRGLALEKLVAALPSVLDIL